MSGFPKILCKAGVVSISRPNSASTKRRASVKKRPRTLLKKKSRSPAYALTILGKILYRRLRKNTLVTKGINLVSNVSSCSLLEWSGRLFSSTNDITKDYNSNMSHREEGKPDLLPAAEGSFKEIIDCNRNVNARTTSGAKQDLEQNMASTSSYHPRNRKRKLRRPGRQRGLIARSIGKPKPSERRTIGGNLKYRMVSTLKKKKLSVRNALVKKLGTQTMSKSTESEDTTLVGTLNRGVPSISPYLAIKLKGIGNQTWSKTEASISKLKTLDTPAARQCAAASTGAKRKSHKWRTLMKLGNTVLARHASVHTTTPKKKRWEKKTADHKAKKEEPPAEVQIKDSSPESSEWPELAVSGRRRAHAKETATGIIKSKHSISATKTTVKKICADNGSKRGKELVSSPNNQQLKDKRKPEPGPGSQKTWASVAAAGAVKCESVIGKTAPTKVELCGEASCSVTPSGSGNQKRKRKKVDYRLAYTDKIWLTCQKSKGNPYFQSHGRKNYVDRKDKVLKRKNAQASPHKKVCSEKQSERIPPQGQVSTSVDEAPVTQTSLDNCCEKSFPSASGIRQGANLRCTSSDRDCQGQNVCLVDNMPVVYTKRAGTVITLNESSHHRSTHRNVNKCNNKNDRAKRCKSNTGGGEIASNKPGVHPDVSGTDLCSQLSSMTFQTPETSSWAIRRESSQPRKVVDCRQLTQSIGPCSGAKTPSEGGGATAKQKKVSLRYRALCRDGCGPLDARTVSDIHTRHRRADTLHDSKVATRAMRRRHRVEHQNTAHSSRRLPATSDTSDATQRHDNSTNRSSTTSDPAQDGKSRAGGGSRANRRFNTKKSEETFGDGTSAHGASTSQNVEQVGIESGASSDSSGEGDAWRPGDNTGANNSCGQCDGNELGDVTVPQLTSLEG